MIHLFARLAKFCITFFLFSLDEDNAYAKLCGVGYTRCIMGEVQMANKENIRICIGKKCAILTVKVRTLLSFFLNKYHEPLVVCLS